MTSNIKEPSPAIPCLDSARQHAAVMAKLREPFTDSLVNYKPQRLCESAAYDKLQKEHCDICGGYHPLNKPGQRRVVGHLSYVGHAAVTKRLLDSDPTWSWEPLSLDANGEPHFDESGGLWIKLTVASHTRLGYGHSEPMKYSEIGSRTKAVISDALRNAAMRFGVALEEWHKGDLGLPDPLILDGSGFGGDGVESPTGKPAVRMPEAAPQPAVVGAGSELPNPAPVCPEEPKAQTAAAASEPMAEEGEVNFITKKLAALKETDADKLILDTIGTGTLDNLTKNNFAKLKLAVKGKK